MEREKLIDLAETINNSNKMLVKAMTEKDITMKNLYIEIVNARLLIANDNLIRSLKEEILSL